MPFRHAGCSLPAGRLHKKRLREKEKSQLQLRAARGDKHPNYYFRNIDGGIIGPVKSDQSNLHNGNVKTILESGIKPISANKPGIKGQ